MRVCLYTFLFLFSYCQIGWSQMLASLVPENTATHTAVQNGSWFDVNTWNVGTVPGNGAIVVIPSGITVNYQGVSNVHIFAIRVDGNFNCTQTNSNQTTTITFDTFIGTMSSYVKFHASNVSDGKINITITPFDIEAFKGQSNNWNSNAMAHFSDGATTYKVTQSVGPDDRFNSYAEALAGNTQVIETSRVLYDDGVGVTGRHHWDPTQLSIGMVTMGQVEIIGQEKLNMSKLSSNALRNQSQLQLASVPEGWKIGDKLIVTHGGNQNTSSNGEDEVEISAINGNTISLTSNLEKNHEGRSADNLHCYVGNLTRNISFSSGSTANVHHRAHIMAMHNNENVQIRNASFKDMGRTDKSRLVDDFIWDKWLDPVVFKSKVSALGQECAQMKANPTDEMTNPRGRYTLHLHKTGAAYGDNITNITGNVVWGNPGWGITHHDSHANVSDNVVYDVVGAGIVSETGSETGFWDNNLVVNIQEGHTTDPYTAALFHDDYLYSGQGLAMKGRAVICRGNVISNTKQGVGVINMNPSVTNLDRLDARALAERPGYEVDNFPLSVNGYSKEGDGVMPVESALIMENTTVIWSNQGLRSIERDMGVNHESRSIFNGFNAWGVNQGLSITYQADYSFKDVFISGKNNNSVGAYLWKHSHNQTFENIKMVDLGYGITVSKLVESGNGQLKTRNNGVTPWIFVNLQTENVGDFYQIIKEDESTATEYNEHSDNAIHLNSSDVTSRDVSFTVLDSTALKVDYATNNFRFEIDGIITDDFGSYDMGIEQAPAQGDLRIGYPTRIYEFASQAKFEEYLLNNGVYKDENNNDQLYFILPESLPNRRSFQYTTFPVRVKIMNALSTGVFASASVESMSSLQPKNQLVSRFATVSQSSTDDTFSYDGEDIDASAEKAIDGNNNGRVNAQIFQRGLVPVGSFSSTKQENEPWFDMDLGEEKIIDYIDVWNTVELNGSAIETVSNHFTNFYVLIAETPFTGMSLSNAKNHANFSYHMNALPQRKLSVNNINVKGRYVRIQAEGVNRIKLAEVEVVGKKISESLSTPNTTIAETLVWPNPTTGEINIKLKKSHKNISVQVYSVVGQLIHQKSFNHTDHMSFKIANVYGVCFLHIKSDEGLNEVKKVIIK
ncbi:T9SS type A sorting domain-containing protein [Wenyingzhuangia sp. IMCC45467]